MLDGGGGASAGSSAGGNGGSDEPEPVPAPEIDAMTPLSGPYGTTVTLSGQGLGSAARPGVSLTLGEGDAALTLFPDDEAVVSWDEAEIAFRVPFPHGGPLVIKTPQGTAQGQVFTPDWVAGPSISMPLGASVLASLAPSANEMVAAFDSDPVRVVSSDGSRWRESTLDPEGIVLATLRLFVSDDDEVLVFALSDDTQPEIVTFELVDDVWQATASGVTVSDEFAIAGGPNGAVVWWRTVDYWSRARHTAGAWAMDLGPIADPDPSRSNHAAGATSDGSLYVVWDQDTGNFLDDTGAPFMQQFEPQAADFSTTVKVGDDIDDFVTSIELLDRGNGLLIHYCGSDVDPLNLSATGYKCRTAARSSAGASLRSWGHNESESTRYAAARSEILVGFCDEDGLHVTADPATPGAAAVWPCPTLDALEIDAQGQAQLFVRLGSALYSPRPSAPPAAVDAGADAAADAGG
jgi:hypothetical protein